MILELVKEIPRPRRNPSAFLLLVHVLPAPELTERPFLPAQDIRDKVSFASGLPAEAGLPVLRRGIEQADDLLRSQGRSALSGLHGLLRRFAGHAVAQRHRVLLPSAQNGDGQGLPSQTRRRSHAGARPRLLRHTFHILGKRLKSTEVSPVRPVAVNSLAAIHRASSLSFHSAADNDRRSPASAVSSAVRKDSTENVFRGQTGRFFWCAVPLPWIMRTWRDAFSPAGGKIIRDQVLYVAGTRRCAGRVCRRWEVLAGPGSVMVAC